MENTDAKFIIFMLEDQWPVEPINNDQIEKTLNYIKKNEDVSAIYLEMGGVEGLKKAFRVNDDFNEIPFGAPY